MERNYNLFELTNLLRNVFLSHPFVNDFMVNKYRLNDTDNITYAACVFTVNSITRQDNLLSFDTNILYVDRLNDKRDNEMAIQSTGLSVMIECLNAIKENTEVAIQTDFTSTPFTEQFADNTAGIFARVTMQVPSYIGNCDWLDPDCIHC